MGLISVGEVINRGLSIMISRIVPVVAVRLIAVAVSMGVALVGMRSFLENLRAAASAAGISAENLQDLIQNLPPEMLIGALMNPMLWVAVVVNILVFLWAQAGVYLALYPNGQTGGGEPRSIKSVLLGSLGLLFPLLIVNVIFGLAVTVGILLLVIPGVWLAVKYGFSPILVAIEGKGAMESLSRSSELVSGYWLPVFLRLLVAGIIAIVGNVVLSFLPVVGGIAASILFPPFLNACQLAILENLKEVKGSA